MEDPKFNVIRRVKGESAGRIVGIVRGEESAKNTVDKRTKGEIDPRYEFVYRPVIPQTKTQKNPTRFL